MSRPTNSNPKSRARNGRKRTGPIFGGTKAKKAARKLARLASRTARHGSTAEAPYTKLVPGQKQRRSDPLDERYTAGLLSALTTARGARGPTRRAPVSGPHRTAREAVRDRTQNRAAGMRYRYDMGPGLNVNPGGEWRDASGVFFPAVIGQRRIAVNAGAV